MRPMFLRGERALGRIAQSRPLPKVTHESPEFSGRDLVPPRDNGRIIPAEGWTHRGGRAPARLSAYVLQASQNRAAPPG